MKRINKILISILAMSILITAVVTSAKDVDTTVPVSTNISDENIANPTSDISVPEIQETKKPTPADEKARFANRMKYAPKIKESKPTQKSTTPKEQQPVEQIAIPSTIPSEIAYSNPVTGTSMFGTLFNSGLVYSDAYINWEAYSFYLPVASYVYTDISGQVNQFSDWAYYNVWMDSDFLSGVNEYGSCNSGYPCYVSIQRSRLTYLPKGWHNLYIDGEAEPYYPSTTNYGYAAFGQVSIIAEPEYTAITVTSPNGGENWSRGTTKSITWKKDGNPGANVKIELYKNGVLSSVISSITPNDGIYSWYIPTYTPIGTDYKIKISSTAEPTKYYDWSNNNFRIY